MNWITKFFGRFFRSEEADNFNRINELSNRYGKNLTAKILSKEFKGENITERDVYNYLETVGKEQGKRGE